MQNAHHHASWQRRIRHFQCELTRCLFINRAGNQALSGLRDWFPKLFFSGWVLWCASRLVSQSNAHDVFGSCIIFFNSASRDVTGITKQGLALNGSSTLVRQGFNIFSCFVTICYHIWFICSTKPLFVHHLS